MQIRAELFHGLYGGVRELVFVNHAVLHHELDVLQRLHVCSGSADTAMRSAYLPGSIVPTSLLRPIRSAALK